MDRVDVELPHPHFLALLAETLNQGHLVLYPQRPIDDMQKRLGLVLQFLEEDRAGGLARFIDSYKQLGLL